MNVPNMDKRRLKGRMHFIRKNPRPTQIIYKRDVHIYGMELDKI
jgi:hypothetical protein